MRSILPAATGQMKRPNLQTAIWSSYFSGQPPPPPARKGPPKLGAVRYSPLPVGTVLETLRSAEGKAESARVGLALWNLLDAYLEKDAPRQFHGLLRDVLNLDINDARLRKQDGKIFPPLAELAETSVWCEVKREREGSLIGNLEMCVLTPFADSPSADDPLKWLRKCDLFSGMHESADQRTLAGKLRLPGQSAAASPDVTLEITSITANRFRRKIEFKVPRNGWLEVCEGSVSKEKERGRPGATRIALRREVRFAPGILQGLQRKTLAYWLQLDTLRLALP